MSLEALAEAGEQPRTGCASEASATTSELFAAAYRELHRLARRQLRSSPASTLGATTLIHEAYMRLAPQTSLSFADRPHFIAYVSRAMRSTIIDHSRRRQAHKSARQLTVSLTDGDAPEPAIEASVCMLYDALQALAKLDPRLAQLIDRHVFGGCSFAELAAMSGVSERTVQRDWRKARVLLEYNLRELNARASTPGE